MTLSFSNGSSVYRSILYFEVRVINPTLVYRPVWSFVAIHR